MFKAGVARNTGNTHIYMEWPKNAYFGWRFKEWEDLRKWLWDNFSQTLYWTEIHGCMYGHKHNEEFINKPWYVLTTDFDFFCSVAVKCDGSHVHRQVFGIGSEAVHATACYPQAMVRRVVQVWKKQWYNTSHAEVTKQLYNTRVNDEDLKQLLSEADHLFPLSVGGSTSSATPQTAGDHAGVGMGTDSVEDKVVLESAPSSKERERVLGMLHRLHRAAGHPTNASLAKLCSPRKMAPWIVEEARNLVCQSCVETQRGMQKVLPVSLSDQTKPWELVAMDAFEPAYPVQQQKARYIIMMCTAMHFVAIACTWVGPLNTTGTDPGHRVIDFLQSLVDASASSQVDSHGQSNFFCARCENTQRTNTPFSSVPVRPRVLIYVLPWSCHTWVPCPLHVFHTPRNETCVTSCFVGVRALHPTFLVPP